VPQEFVTLPVGPFRTALASESGKQVGDDNVTVTAVMEAG